MTLSAAAIIGAGVAFAGFAIGAGVAFAGFAVGDGFDRAALESLLRWAGGG